LHRRCSYLRYFLIISQDVKLTYASIRPWFRVFRLLPEDQVKNIAVTTIENYMPSDARIRVVIDKEGARRIVILNMTHVANACHFIDIRGYNVFRDAL
jgi:hypothetical protein